MADFMTVLAASQKQAPTVANGKALAGLLPEGLFGHVLAEQFGAKAAGEVSPLLLTGAFSLPDAPMSLPAASADDAHLPESAPPLDAGVDPVDAETVPGMPGVPPLQVGADPVSGEKSLVSPPVTLAVADAKGGDKSEPASATRPLSSRNNAGGVATSAAPGQAWRQDLPAGEAAQRVANAVIAPIPGAVESLLPRVEAGSVMEAMRPVDQSAIVATRQPGPLEQMVRPTEIRAQAAIEAPLRSQQFPVEFSEKIVWMVGRQSQVADLSLNPPQLGALEVRLSLSAGEAGAQFYSPNPVVRDAIEAALPRLRELMAQAGIALGDAQVRDESFARQDAEGGAGTRGGSPAGAMEGAFAAGVNVVRQAGLGLVDLYV